MPVIAAIVKCKKCGAEVRSDWKCCPKCATRLPALASTKPVPRNSVLQQVGAIDGIMARPC